MTLDNNEFWEGLDPKKPERLSKVLAALHCFHIAPPTDLFHYEFTVHPADHHRICGTFPELRSLEELIGKPIPFHFNASTGSLTTMYDARHHVGVAMALAIETGISLRSFYSYPGSVGALARRVQLQSGYPLVRATGHDQDGKPTGNAGPPALAFTSPLSKHPTLVLDFAGHENNAPSKHAQYITMHGARTVVSLQLSFNTMTPLGDKAKYKRMADNTAVWVWTTVNGEVKAVVQREPLSTPGGQIKLWLSDFSPMGEDKDLPSEFVRPLRDVRTRCKHYDPVLGHS
ncbi:hypothetical protein B0I37DRAFT_159097 [Chaetomium sp. MPI-CAGE-AT-0009]|nr:hypothetical protein B0I37DRAFT_159097 [Chaetomium sp. MPI-CAGE-AT-0009]